MYLTTKLYHVNRCSICKRGGGGTGSIFNPDATSNLAKAVTAFAKHPALEQKVTGFSNMTLKIEERSLLLSYGIDS